MNVPGFSAQASLYQSNRHYITPRIGSAGAVLPQAQAMMLDDGQLQWCRLFCAYCRYYGYFCWPCYICGWIIVLGGGTSTQGLGTTQ